MIDHVVQMNIGLQWVDDGLRLLLIELDEELVHYLQLEIERLMHIYLDLNITEWIIVMYDELIIGIDIGKDGML